MKHFSLHIKKNVLLIDTSNHSTNNEFDFIHISNSEYELFIDGIVLNDKELLIEYNYKNLNELIYDKFISDITFLNKLRGSFLGYLYNKKDKKINVFSDHLSSKNIYYLKKNDEIFISTQFQDFFKQKLKIDQRSAINLLSYGYMLDDLTILENVKKINPGTILSINLKDINPNFINYFKFKSHKINISLDEAIDKLDILFRQAVKRQFDKDLQYNKKHFVALSGGLDSRMTSWVAHHMGYKKQINFTFSQSNYLDETIAKTIAADLKHDWIFKFLDNGNFLFDLDEITTISGGNVLYYGLAHGNSFLKLLNFNELGILHSGQLGDVIIGSFIKNLETKSLNEVSGLYSKLGADLAGITKAYTSFEEKEIDLIYQRGINGANSGLMLINHYTETYSPFYDIDFMEFCLSIPIDRRINHKLYKAWILKKYPRAADYIWESTKKKINTKEPQINILGKKIYITEIGNALLRKLKLKKVPISTKNNMNPLQYWYDTNLDLKKFIDQYYASNISRLDDVPNLKELVTKLFNNGTAVEKNQVLSLLSLLRKL